MKIWYFHGHYITNGLGTNEISYNIFDLRPEEKQECLYIHSSIRTKKVEKY